MPGLIGFAGAPGSVAESERLAAMARALEPEGRFREALYHEQCLGLGRIAGPVVQPETQPIWDATHTVCMVLEGEIYDRPALLARLTDRDRPAPDASDTEILLRLFLTQGAGAAAHVNGEFAAAFWDRRNRRLTLVNDRLGLYPLYWAEYEGRLVFASGVRALLADLRLPRRMDRLAMAQFLTFDHVLGTRTLLEDVHLLDPGTVLTWEAGRRELRAHWRPQHPEAFALRTEADWMEGLIHHLRQAVHRQLPDDRATGILLSGGLDSRVLLALLAETPNGKSLTSFTWGIPGCDDDRYARALARVARVPHQFNELRPDWLLHQANEAVRITDGLGNIVNMHALANAAEEAQHAQVMYKGFLGDAMLGFGLRHFHWGRYGAETWALAHMQTLRDRGVITFDTQERAALFSEPFQAALGDSLLESYATVMAESASPDLADQRIVYDFRQRVPRMTLNGVEALRGHMHVRLPFADNDLVDYTLSVPPGLRYERRLIKNAFIRAFPAYAQVPSTETGLPLMDNLTSVRLQAENWARWHARRVIKSVRYPRQRPYKDYHNWLRGPLRPWLESILLSPRALGRGYFQPDSVRRLVVQHMAGANHTVKLGALMSLELWQRQFLEDGTDTSDGEGRA
jgi:asparagine synthase (glutamine-hydrolysing)